MRWTGRARNLYRLLFQHRELEADLDAEVDSYFEILVERYLTQGLSQGVVRRRCCGLLLAAFGVRALVAYGPGDIPRLEQTALDPSVLAFTLVVSLLAAVLFALFPAAKLANRHFSSKGAGLPATLVAAEFALTVVLLTGAGLLIRSFLAVQAIDPGFDPEDVLTVQVTPGTPQSSFYAQVLERIAGVARVRAAGAIGGGLFEPALASGHGQAPQIKNGPLRVWADWKIVRGRYFQAMGIPLLRGRPFHSRDRSGAPLVAIVDQSTARRYWPGQDPIGKRTPYVFEPAAQDDNIGPTRDLVIRTAVISRIATMEQRLNDHTSPRRFQTSLLASLPV